MAIASIPEAVRSICDPGRATDNARAAGGDSTTGGYVTQVRASHRASELNSPSHSHRSNAVRDSNDGAYRGSEVTNAILMYHAVIGHHLPSADWDPHYAVSDQTFRAHLGLLAARGLAIRSVASATTRPLPNTVYLTFDDGLDTDFDVALPALLAHDASADFFVSADLVGTKSYSSWSQLADMAKAGMSIQSHGASHRLLNTLTDAEIRDELVRSKNVIEDRLNRAVTLYAPAGGRRPSRAVRIAREAGYERICASRPGLWSTQTSYVLPRFAVLTTTESQRIAAWALGDRGACLRATTRHWALALTRKLLGENGYGVLRSRLLSRET